MAVTAPDNMSKIFSRSDKLSSLTDENPKRYTRLTGRMTPASKSIATSLDQEIPFLIKP